VCDVARVLRAHAVARVLQCSAVCCSVLQCVAVCYSVLWCDARVLRARLCRPHVLIRDAFHCDCSVSTVCVVLRCVVSPTSCKSFIVSAQCRLFRCVYVLRYVVHLEIMYIFHSSSAVQSISMLV